MKPASRWMFIACMLAFSLPAAWAQEAAAPVPHRVELNTGEVFIGPLVRQDETHVVIAHAIAGELSLPRNLIKQVTDTTAAPTPAPAPEVAPPPVTVEPPAAAAPPPTPEPQKPEHPLGFIGEFLSLWNVQLAFGFDHREATHQSSAYNLGVAANYADERDRWKLDIRGFYAEVDDARSREDYHVALQKDWLLPKSPWFLFAQVDYDRDNFKSWDHRLATHGGLGYELKQWLGIDAKLRGGFGVTREYGGVDPDTRPEGLASSELSWKINETHTLAGTVMYYPGLDDSENFRIRATGDWTISLSSILGLKLGVWNEYDSTEPEGFEKNDMRLYGALVYSF